MVCVANFVFFSSMFSHWKPFLSTLTKSVGETFIAGVPSSEFLMGYPNDFFDCDVFTAKNPGLVEEGQNLHSEVTEAAQEFCKQIFAGLMEYVEGMGDEEEALAWYCSENVKAFGMNIFTIFEEAREAMNCGCVEPDGELFADDEPSEAEAAFAKLFSSSLRKFSGATPSKQDANRAKCDQMFTEADRDGDGFLGYNDLCWLAKKTTGQEAQFPEEQFGELCRELDADEPGLTQPQLYRSYMELGMGDIAEDFDKVFAGSLKEKNTDLENRVSELEKIVKALVSEIKNLYLKNEDLK